MSDLISVIVPCYNIEKYLSFCLNSLAKQTYTNFEVLCVDDGSTDSTASVIRTFCDNDGRFKLLPKENGGVSSARNYGIDNAKGEYIAFIDGDDYISPDFLMKLHAIITEHNADIARCNGRGVTSYDYVEPTPDTEPYVVTRNKMEALSIFYDNVFRGWYGDDAVSACMSLYSKNVLKNVRFSTLLKNAEDECFTQMVISEAEKVVYCGDKMYFYYRREGSASHRPIPESEKLTTKKNLYYTRDEFFRQRGLSEIVSLNAKAACDNFVGFYISDKSDKSVKKEAVALFKVFYEKQTAPLRHHKLFKISPIIYSLYAKITK